MSVIESNSFTNPFESPSPLAEFGLGSAGGFGETPARPAGADDIRFAPPNSVVAPLEAPCIGSSFGAAPPQSPSCWNFSSIMNAITSAIGALFAQLGGTFGQTGSQAPAPLPGQAFFTSASGSSNGDPHLAFDGTTAAGATVKGTWDDMHGHADLLSSSSFSGGYRVATTATNPNGKGVTYNASATVTAQNGAASVRMDADGSYAVTEDGRAITLQPGTATALGGGETVTLASDGSLTVTDAAAGGGSIATTLRASGGGVDVSNTARNVELGGYLVSHGDGSPSWSAPYEPVAPALQNDPTSFLQSEMERAYASVEPPWRFANPASAQTLGSGLESFDPDARSTRLQSLEAE